MTACDLKQMSEFRRTKKGVRLIDDRGALIVEWRDGCPDQPATHDDACSQALALIRARFSEAS